MTDVNRRRTDAGHIRLICWDHHHVTAISELALRTLNCAPICTYMMGEYGNLCSSAIWAVRHEGEPQRYAGKPPHQRWELWAECIKDELSATDNSARYLKAICHRWKELEARVLSDGEKREFDLLTKLVVEADTNART